MADTSWTKGPWGVQAKIDIRIMAGSLHVATIPRAADGDWSPHNARLIAAAPDMAEAHDENARILGYLVNELQGRIEAGKLEALNKCLQRSLAMSAKARGEQ